MIPVSGKQRAFIGIGSNLGNPPHQCHEALNRLAELPETSIKAVSPFYRTEPLTPTGSAENIPWFVNAVCELETGLSPLGLLVHLDIIEREMGRRRVVRWEPRLIDLDLLFFGNVITSLPALSLPHPEIANRLFVLQPLCDIAPDWIHPVTGETAQSLLGKWKGHLAIERLSQELAA